jgi:putative nucleotidyltransferase with HDIG domain
VSSRRPGEAVTGLARARRTASLYGPQHPVAARTIDETYRAIHGLLGDRPSLRLFIYDDTFYVGRTVLLEESLRLGGLMTELTERQVGSIEFFAGLEAWEIRALVEVLNLRPAELQALGGVSAALQQREVRHVSASSAPPMAAEERGQFHIEPRDVYRAGLRVADDLYHQASRDLPLDVKKAGIVVGSLIDLLTTDRAALMGLAALGAYDEETAHHSVNTAVLSLLIGLRLGLRRDVLNALGLAALLHDIGKVRLPREVLTREGPPTEAERVLIRRHTLYGAHVLRNLPGLSRLAMVVAFEHHANFDRSGYPRLVAKTVPHPLTRIVHVADFYDATASARPDRRRLLPHETVTLILERAGTTFDPTPARAFVQVLGRFPVGSLVVLSTGEAAVVVRPGEDDPERPTVTVVADATQRSLPPRTVRLEEERSLEIARALDPTEVPIDVTAHLWAGASTE